MKQFLDEKIGILIHQTDLALISLAKAKLEHLNITPEQNLVLLLLLEHDGLTQNQIAKSLNKDKTNICRMITQLEKKKVIVRDMNESDHRSFKVYLTESGKQLGKQLDPITREHSQIVLSGISAEDLQIVKKVLMKMRQNVEANREAN